MNVTSFAPFDPVICPACSAETHVKKDFGGYRLDQRFAVGGMSVIFAGWDTTLDRRVAIKVLNEEFCNDEIRIQSFENEARLTAQVSHPNVVKVYGVGRAYGRFYLVMELLKGQSFEHIIAKRGALPENEVLEIALQVGAGLRAAKNAGMIHRDVKPGNILIDESGHTRLLDFGLALITQDGRAQAEEVWATPYYVPPEALERGIEDFRSDIYAFGASLYHALAGRPPFESTTTSNSLLRRAKQTIPRLCKVAPWISPGTGEVVDRMMAFKPDHRWASYGQVLKALENAKKKASQKAPTPIHSRSRLKRRKQKSYYGLVFALLVIALCTSLAIWKPWEKKSLPPVTGPDTTDIPVDRSPLFNPGGTKEAELYDSWKTARNLIRQKEYREASLAFSQLSREPTLAGMSQIWASFEAAVASSLAGRPKKSRDLISTSLVDLDKLSKQRTLQKKYRSAAEALGRIAPLSGTEFPQKPKGVEDWMITFALALKQWEQGQWELALPTFAKVRAARLPEELSWFATYQNIADIYLADGLVLTQLKKISSPSNAEEVDKALAALAEAAEKIQTEGRAPYNLKAHQEHLARLRRSFNDQPSIKLPSDWPGHRSLLRKTARKLRLDDLAALLENPPPGSPPEALAAWRYLSRKASLFTRDLSSQDDWTIVKKDGQEFNPVSGNASGASLSDGTIILWSQLKPMELLSEHSGNPRHAIAFAWLAGLTHEAEGRAEVLAGQNEKFRNEWRSVIIGITQ